MRTTARILGRAILAVAVGLTVGGCGGKPDSPPPDQKTPEPEKKDQPGAPNPNPKDPTTDPAKPGPAAWEMDPTKHAIPASPVGGQLAGAPFAPEVQVQGNVLRFRLFKDGLPERQVELRYIDAGKKFVDTKVTVKPDQPTGPDVPLVLLTRPGPEPKDPPFFDKGYALTLELGKREGGKVPGKVYLSLPGAEKEFLAGTFAAEYVRTAEEPPGPDDAPFIQGKVTIAGSAGPPGVRVGYLRIDPYDAAEPATVHSDLIGTILQPGGFPVRSEAYRPRVASLFPGAAATDPARYELTKLDPGRYWVFATLDGGPVVGQWLTVAAGGQLTADLTIDAAAVGALEVTIPGPADKVYVLPAAQPEKPWPDLLVFTAGSLSGLQADVPKGDGSKKDAVVAFAKLSPGKYEVWAGDFTGTAEVKRGETAKLTLTPATQRFPP